MDASVVNMYLKLLLLLLVTTSVLCKKGDKIIHVDVDKYQTCLPMLARPAHTNAVPPRLIRIRSFGGNHELLTATRHHIIPYNTLSSFFNLVLEEDYRTELGAYLGDRVRAIYDFFNNNPEVGEFPPELAPVFLNRTIPQGFRDFNVDYRMAAAFAWMPGNIFYGPPPDRRADDPGEGFEVNAARIVGNYSFAILRRTNDNMVRFITNTIARTIRNFNAIIEDLNVIAQHNTPYEFHKSDWEPADVKKNKTRFDITSEPLGTEDIEELTTTIRSTTTRIHDGLRRRSLGDKSTAAAAFISAIADNDLEAHVDYLNAAHQVCQEYVRHSSPKLNPNIIKNVDIEAGVDVLFVYSINNKNYVYGQNRETMRWSIKKVGLDGRVGALTDQGVWNNYYAVQFPFQINGKQYFYGHNLETHYWFTQELREDGTMGREIDNGHFKYSYAASFPISINGQQYFYGQNMDSSCKNWFLQELNSDGSMGREVSHGTWVHTYNIQFPFNLGHKQYFGGHNTVSKLHFLREISANNIQTMGQPKFWGPLDDSYAVLFPIQFGGNSYLFLHNPVNGKWFIREFFGGVVDSNSVNFSFDIAYPFNINGYQYFYGRNKNDHRWSLVHFDLKYSSANIK